MHYFTDYCFIYFPGESDGRKLEDLETLKWRPQNSVPDLDLDQYLSVAKAVYLITRLLNEQSSQNITSNTTPSEESNTTTESSKETNSSSVQDQNDARDCKNDDKCGENIDNAQKKPKDSEWDDSIEYLRIALKGLVSNYLMTLMFISHSLTHSLIFTLPI